MNLDDLKDRLGGKWYDVWWLAIAERFDPFPPRSYAPDFFEYINEGWLDMYYEPPTELERKEEYIKSFFNSNPYYNEKYYDYEV